MKNPSLFGTPFSYIRGNYSDSPNHIVETDALYRFPICGSGIAEEPAYKYSKAPAQMFPTTDKRVCERCLTAYDVRTNRLLSLETEAQRALTEALHKAVHAIKTYESDTFSAWGCALIDAEAYAMAVALMTRAAEMIEQTGKMKFDGTVLDAMLDEMREKPRARKAVKR